MILLHRLLSLHHIVIMVAAVARFSTANHASFINSNKIRHSRHFDCRDKSITHFRLSPSFFGPLSPTKPIATSSSPRRTTRCNMSTQSKEKSTNEASFKVILQNVVRDIPLPILIYYIRNAFVIPSNLAMPYEAISTASANDQDDGVVASWHCPISPEQSLLTAEVIGIRKGEEIIPSMAMVAVKRHVGSGKSKNAGQMQSLLEASEKQILSELERGLDDLGMNKSKQKQISREMALEEVEQEEESVAEASTDKKSIVSKEENVKTTQKEEEKEEPAKMLKQHVDDDNENDMFGDFYTSNAAPSSQGKQTPKDVVVDVEVSNVEPSEKNKGGSSSFSSTTTTKSIDVDMIPDNDPRSDNGDTSTTSDSVKNIDLNKHEVIAEEMDEEGSVTPEDLLSDMLKFGKDEAEKDRPGAEFAKGAFQKAKELLRQPSEMKQEQQMQGQELDEYVKEPEILEMNPPPTDAQEELRRIFAAGEELAEGKIVGSPSVTNSDIVSKRSIDDELESLISSEASSVPKATSIEEELAELSLQIKLDPDDDPITEPVFDIFAGPQKVKSSSGQNLFGDDDDAATAVNYPGAIPGTKQVTLHPELEEAVQNANFAASILLQIHEMPDGRYLVNGKDEISKAQIDKMEKCVNEAVEVGLIEDPFTYMEERYRLQSLLTELGNQPEDRFTEISAEYKDLLCSDNFVPLVREKLTDNTSELENGNADKKQLEVEQENLSKLTNYAMSLLKEAQGLHAELEAMQLETIRSICSVAMDPSHSTEEQAAIALSDTVRDMRPLLDENFVSYLKYAIAEEEGKLARRGLLDDPDHNQWLFVLQIVQQGVYAELGKSVQRYIDHVWYILRMDSKLERRRLLEVLVDDLPSLDVRPFKKVVENIVGSLGAGVKGDFDTEVLGGMTKRLLQMNSDMKEVLTPAKIKIKSKDADEWIRGQKEKVVEMQEEKRKRLRAKREEREEGDGGILTGETDRMP